MAEPLPVNCLLTTADTLWPRKSIDGLRNSEDLSLHKRVACRHTYKLDTAAAPKGIALRTVDTRALFDRSAIYELDGDTLKICIVHGAKRPARFATQKGGATSTYILKKQ